MDELELLRERNKHLTRMCESLCELTAGMMKAAAEDNPELLELDYYVRGQQQIEEMSLYLKDTKGEG